MQRVSLYEAKNNLSLFVHLAEQGERIEITRHGKTAAMLTCAEENNGTIFDEKSPFYLAYLDLRKKLASSDFSQKEWNDIFLMERNKSVLRHPEDFE